MAGVALTTDEWTFVQAHFPKLHGHQNACLKTGNATSVYNCIAWSVGSQTEWINPPQPQAAFVQFYHGRGYQVCPEAEATVDGYGTATGVMLHGSRHDGAVWSSKLGQAWRMTHPRDGLTTPGVYGDIVVHFKHQPPHPTAPTSVKVTASQGATATVLDQPSAAKVTAVAHDSAQAFPILRNVFDKNWAAWQKTWTDKKSELAQSSHTFATGTEFAALVKMGASILPLVVEKLKSNDNIFACELYNSLQTDSKKKVDPKNLEEYWVLNNQAKEIVKLYGSQVKHFEVLATDWAASKSAASLSSDSKSFVSGPAYEALREMGKPAIPLIMNNYANDRAGWWHELLHEIVHGAESGAQTFDKTALYEHWSNWFQGADGPAGSAGGAAAA